MLNARKKEIYIFYCFFTIYSRYLKRVISKRDECEYLKQVPSIDGSLEKEIYKNEYINLIFIILRKLATTKEQEI
jgi:UDP-N-acetylglucosamine pyrophosphorylase